MTVPHWLWRLKKSYPVNENIQIEPHIQTGPGANVQADKASHTVLTYQNHTHYQPLEQGNRIPPPIPPKQMLNQGNEDQNVQPTHEGYEKLEPSYRQVDQTSGEVDHSNLQTDSREEEMGQNYIEVISAEEYHFHTSQ